MGQGIIAHFHNIALNMHSIGISYARLLTVKVLRNPTSSQNFLKLSAVRVVCVYTRVTRFGCL